MRLLRRHWRPSLLLLLLLVRQLLLLRLLLLLLRLLRIAQRRRHVGQVRCVRIQLLLRSGPLQRSQRCGRNRSGGGGCRCGRR